MHHQGDDLTRREMIARRFVGLLVKTPDQVFKQPSHHEIVNAVGMQVKITKA